MGHVLVGLDFFPFPFHLSYQVGGIIKHTCAHCREEKRTEVGVGFHHSRPPLKGEYSVGTKYLKLNVINPGEQMGNQTGL